MLGKDSLGSLCVEGSELGSKGGGETYTTLPNRQEPPNVQGFVQEVVREVRFFVLFCRFSLLGVAQVVVVLR